jgi:hypothetical protein
MPERPLHLNLQEDSFFRRLVPEYAALQLPRASRGDNYGSRKPSSSTAIGDPSTSTATETISTKSAQDKQKKLHWKLRKTIEGEDMVGTSKAFNTGRARSLLSLSLTTT